MALISDIAGSLDLGGGSLLLQVNQGEREPISVQFVDEEKNPVDISNWTFSVSTEFAYVGLEVRDGRPVLSNFALSTSRQTTGTLTVSKSPLVPNQLDLLLPENLYTGTVPFNETRRVPSVVVYLRVQQGSEPTSPVDIMRWIVAMRRTSGQPISPDSPLTPQTPSGVPTGGLDREQVVALIASPAREGSTERWALSKVPTLASLGGLDQAAVDGRIMTLRPRIFTASDETKLDGIEENATADQTPTEIRDAIQGLSGANRLSYNNLKDQPTIPTPRTNAEIDGRIISTARTGNTSRWAKNKLPSDTIYTATQRFSSADETKLDGIEANAKDDQSPTEIRDALAGLSGNARLAASAIQGLPSGGGTASSLWTLMAQPASDVVVAQPANNTDWGDWNDLATTGAVATGNAGQVVFGADCHVVVAGTGSSGGDRCFTEFRVVRRRGSTDTTLLSENIYGPRNGTNFGGIAVAASSAASGSLIGTTTVQEGDTMKLQVRLAIQTTANTKSFTFAATRNEVFMAGVS